jgi:hypothetical protein
MALKPSAFFSGFTRRANSSTASRSGFVRHQLALSLTHTMTSSAIAYCQNPVGGSSADF